MIARCITLRIQIFVHCLHISFYQFFKISDLYVQFLLYACNVVTKNRIRTYQFLLKYSTFHRGYTKAQNPSGQIQSRIHSTQFRTGSRVFQHFIFSAVEYFIFFWHNVFACMQHVTYHVSSLRLRTNVVATSEFQMGSARSLKVQHSALRYAILTLLDYRLSNLKCGTYVYM